MNTAIRSTQTLPVGHTIDVTQLRPRVTESGHQPAAKEEITKPKLVFDPYSQEYFDDPYEIYRRMRDETPIYYDEEQDFYALTRHADVAAALKDHESFSSTRGCHLNMIKSGKGFQKSIIFMDPPEHRFMRSLLNKAFTPRAIQSQRDTVVELVEHYLSKVDPDNFDVVQDFSGPFRRGDHPDGRVPEEFRQQVRHWIEGLEVKPGQVDLSEENMQANMDAGVYYFGLVQERRHDPQDDMISRLIAAEIPGENGEMRKLDDIEITGFVALLGARAPRPSPSWSAVPWSSSRGIPSSGRCCSTTAACYPPPSRSCCAMWVRCSTTCATR
ncbi:hypothetical protein MCEL_00020 [Mycolicibacterium celeriflavum]|uniref:Cytochrome P450 n=1 Tax=Mycolicibacterium celeriflavum TaxID=1249101 RepID=A0A7I7RB35_MYCCF|nr:hypothetical protein MCEL_00020 [Mycolicibacterium celeriflavum]